MRNPCAVVVAFLFVLNAVASGQWTRTSGPSGGYPYSFLTSGSTTYVGTASGVFRSTDNGDTWSPSSSGLPQAQVTSLAEHSGTLFAGTLGGGVFASTNAGNSWSPMNTGLTNLFVRDLEVIPGVPIATLLAGTDNGVYRASSVSLTWSEANSGLSLTIVTSFALLGGEVFAGTSGSAVYRSTNEGADWIFDNDGSLGNTIVNSLTVAGSNLFAGTAEGIYRRSGLASWTAVHPDTTIPLPFVSVLMTGALVPYAGTADGRVFSSTDQGSSWVALSVATLPRSGVNALHFDGTFIFAGVHARGVYRLLGGQWVESNIGLSNTIVNAVLYTGNAIIAGSGDAGLARSTDGGSSWATTYIDSTTTYVTALAASGATLFAGTDAGMLRSTDDGATWAPINSGLSNRVVNALLVSSANSYVYAGTANGVFRSTNSGSNWAAASSGLSNRYVRSLAENGILLFAGTSAGVSSSVNNGSTWTATTLTGMVVNELTAVGGRLYAGTASGVLGSQDNGANWDAVNSGLTHLDVKALLGIDAHLLAGTWGGEVFHLMADDTIWTNISAGLGSAPVLSLATNGSELIAGTNLEGVWKGSLTTVGVDARATVPRRFRLHPNYPNPFNPSTTLSFELPVTSHVRLTIVDLLGRQMVVLIDEQVSSGFHSLLFDGSSYPSGVYFYRLESGGHSSAKKLLLLK